MWQFNPKRFLSVAISLLVSSHSSQAPLQCSSWTAVIGSLVYSHVLSPHYELNCGFREGRDIGPDLQNLLVLMGPPFNKSWGRLLCFWPPCNRIPSPTALPALSPILWRASSMGDSFRTSNSSTQGDGVEASGACTCWGLRSVCLCPTGWTAGTTQAGNLVNHLETASAYSTLRFFFLCPSLNYEISPCVFIPLPPALIVGHKCLRFLTSVPCFICHKKIFIEGRIQSERSRKLSHG